MEVEIDEGSPEVGDVDELVLESSIPPEKTKKKKSKDLPPSILADAYKSLPHFEDHDGISIFEELGLIDCGPLALTTFGTMISCRIAKPISLFIAGNSSAGKSTLVKAIRDNLIPRPWFENTSFSDMTYSSLTRLIDGFKHKVVIVEEACVLTDETETFFRLMISEQKFRRTITGIDGRPTTLLIEGPCAFIQTISDDIRTVKVDNRTRSLIAYTNESPATTLKVMERMALEAALGKTLKNEERFEKIRNRLDRLAQFEEELGYLIDIRVPFASSILPKLSSARGMRDFQKMLSLVRAIAWYRRPDDKIRKDPSTGKLYLDAELLDYRIAYPILLLCQSEMTDEYGTEIKHWKTTLSYLKRRGEFTLADVKLAVDREKSQCQKLVNVWLKLELISLAQKGVQRSGSVYHVLDSDASTSQVFVHPDALENALSVH